MTEVKIYLKLSEEIEQILAENSIGIVDVLQNENIDAEVTYGVLPSMLEQEERTKDIVAIILAGTAAVFSISYAISKILNTIYNKPYLVEVFDYEESKDSQGKIIVKEVKKYQLIEPRKEERKNDFEFNFDIKNGLVIKVSSQEKELDSN